MREKRTPLRRVREILVIVKLALDVILELLGP